MPHETFREYTEAVRQVADLAQVVGEVVQLRRAGRSLTGLCPFHQERSPSFHVDSGKGLYYCFGCGAGGDVFKFVMGVHGLEFADAVHFLADRHGIQRPTRGPNREQEAAETRQRDRIFKALQLAHEFFVAKLKGPEGEGARRYLAERGYDADAVQSLGLGFSVNSWDGLLRHLVGQHNFQPQELNDAGLVVPGQEGRGFYDRFRGRVIFPIRDSSGRLISFAGRSIDGSDPKYINGPETPVYDKGKTLYRLHDASNVMRTRGRAVVVEGYFDAISLARVGIGEAVAVCGTALGQAHARLLRRWAAQVVLFLDADEAGRRAVHRALPVLLAEGLAVRIATTPGGKDPDDLARQGGISAVEAALAEADDLPAYLVREARRTFDVVSLEGRVAAMEMVLGHLMHLGSELARAEAAARVADGLGFDDGIMRQELRRAAQHRQKSIAADKLQSRRATVVLSTAEATLLRFLTQPHIAPDATREALLDAVPMDSLTNLARLAADRWRAAEARGEACELRRLAEELPESDRAPLVALAFAQPDEPTWSEAAEAVSSLQVTQIEAELRAVQARLESLARAGASADPVEADRLLQTKLDLGRQLQRLRQAPPAVSPGRPPHPKGGMGEEAVI
ncbi:MAG: DNA primase [Acidobacteriota bacterium]